MSTKKISVDPAFFKFGGSKTLKRRERKKTIVEVGTITTTTTTAKRTL